VLPLPYPKVKKRVCFPSLTQKVRGKGLPREGLANQAKETLWVRSCFFHSFSLPFSSGRERRKCKKLPAHREFLFFLKHPFLKGCFKKNPYEKGRSKGVLPYPKGEGEGKEIFSGFGFFCF